MGFTLCLPSKISWSRKEAADHYSKFWTRIKQRATSLWGREGPGRSKYSYVCHVFCGQVHTTHRKQGQAITPTPTLQPTKGLHCFPDCQATFFHVGILPSAIASIFLTIQLQSLTDMHGHTEVLWNFLFSSHQILQPFGLRCISLSGPLCLIMPSKHWSNLMMQNTCLKVSYQPKHRVAWATQFSQPSSPAGFGCSFTKLPNPNL